MEGLTALIQEYERKRLITCVKIARRALVLSHMFFADDSYIYCKTNELEAHYIGQMMQTYEKASGQQINKRKSSLLFSINTGQEERDAICTTSGFREAGEETTYLGLPNVVSRNKNAVFGYIRSRMQNRIEGWEKRFMSKGRKELLLKTVSQALPSYAMSTFLIPKSLCNKMESLMCKFC